jgi:hypothetical protein
MNMNLQSNAFPTIDAGSTVAQRHSVCSQALLVLLSVLWGCRFRSALVYLSVLSACLCCFHSALAARQTVGGGTRGAIPARAAHSWRWPFDQAAF